MLTVLKSELRGSLNSARLLLAPTLALMLAGCGGGATGSGSNPPGSTLPPPPGPSTLLAIS